MSRDGARMKEAEARLRQEAAERTGPALEWLDNHHRDVVVLLGAKGNNQAAWVLGLAPSTMFRWRKRRGFPVREYGSRSHRLPEEEPEPAASTEASLDEDRTTLHQNDAGSADVEPGPGVLDMMEMMPKVPAPEPAEELSAEYWRGQALAWQEVAYLLLETRRKESVA